MADYSFISLDEFIARVDRQDLYIGYIVNVGFASITPIWESDSPELIIPSFENNYSYEQVRIIWLQTIDTSPEMRLKSLGEDPTKWSDFWGSTKLQRFAAEDFAIKNNGTIKNRNSADIHVEYAQTIGLEYNPTIINRTQYFRKDGTLIPQEGEIKQLSRYSLKYFEMWLDSPSENYGQVVHKIILNVGYSIVNSPKVLFTGSSWAGYQANSNERLEALIDVGPGMLLKGLTVTGAVTRSGRGLSGYNKFLRNNPIYKGSAGLPAGMSWQSNASRAFQLNGQNVIMIDNASDILDVLGIASETYEKSSNVTP